MTLDAFRDYLERLRRRPGSGWPSTRARVVYAHGRLRHEVTEAIRAVHRRARRPRGDPATKCWRCAGSSRNRRAPRPEARLRRARRHRVPRPVPPARPRPRRAADRPPQPLGRARWLTRAGHLPREAEADLREAYDFYRTVEGRLRIIQNRSTSEWPEDDDGLARLVRRLGHPDGNCEALAGFRHDVTRHAEAVRRWFDALVGPIRKPAGRSS